jgi:hypothetical protein
MKRAICAVWFCFCLQGYGQLLLNPGDSWAYQFSDLPKTGTVSIFNSTPSGVLDFTIDGATFQSGDVLRFEMFENSASEAPICTGTLSSAPPFEGMCETNMAWQDRQGAIRLTMLSGSVTVDNITVKAIIPGASLTVNDVYSSTFVPLPEPATLSLFAAALCAGLFGRHRMRRMEEKRN